MLHRICVAVASRHTRTICKTVKPTQSSFHSAIPSALFSATDKDLPSPADFTPIEKVYDHDKDILLEQIQKAKFVDRVLELVSMHVDVMNDKHICSSFEVIHDQIKDTNDPIAYTASLTKHPTFQSLCNRTMTRARYFEPQDVITVYKTLTKLHVSSNTYIMQAMLKMLCSQVNELSLRELTFVNFLLQKQTRSPIVDSLKLALPLVLQVQIDQQLDSEDLQETVNCLKMACNAKLKPAIIEKVVKTILRRVPDFTAHHAINVVFALATLRTPVDGYMQLLKSSFEVISKNMHELTQQMAIDFMKVCRRNKFYYRRFFLGVSEKAVSAQWELHDCYDLMANLLKLDFFSPELLNCLTDRILSNVETVKVHSKYSALTISEFYTSSSFCPPNVHKVFEVLASAEGKLNAMFETFPHLYFKLLCRWAMLGYFPEDKLKKILNEDFLFSSHSVAKKLGRIAEYEQEVLCLQWSLELYRKNKDIVIPEGYLKMVIPYIQQAHLKSAEFPLTNFLESGLGGQCFFLNGVFTRSGHMIDHLLAMRNGNYPVSLSHVKRESDDDQQILYVEDIQLPEDAKTIALIVAKKEHYYTDPEILKGFTAMKVKSLSAMSYSPVVINYENWYQLPDREKIPILMREIKQAIQDENVPKTNLCPL